MKTDGMEIIWKDNNGSKIEKGRKCCKIFYPKKEKKLFKNKTHYVTKLFTFNRVKQNNNLKN